MDHRLSSPSPDGSASVARMERSDIRDFGARPPRISLRSIRATCSVRSLERPVPIFLCSTRLCLDSYNTAGNLNAGRAASVAALKCSGLIFLNRTAGINSRNDCAVRGRRNDIGAIRSLECAILVIFHAAIFHPDHCAPYDPPISYNALLLSFTASAST